MDTLLYLVARALVAFLQALPLRGVARLGRAGGALAYYLDTRHRRVALHNLAMCFGHEKSPAEIRVLARENFRRLGENYACAVKTAGMTPEQLHPHFGFVGAEKILPHQANQGPQSRVVAIGHFGNFELYARFGQFVPVFKCATTYRGLRQPSLNRLMQSLRERSGCRFFERRTEAAALKACMSQTGLLLGLLSDQRVARGGVRVPFLGHDCSTSASPAVFALRYHCPLHTGICYRTGLARWQIEAGDEIPTRENGRPRPTREIMLDVNRAFEVAVRRDPANWFWVHDRWKLPKSGVQSPESGVQSRTDGNGPVNAPHARLTPRVSRILVRGVNWLGDAVMSTPALLRLRERFPEAHITLLTPEKLCDLWLHHPAVNEVVLFAAGEGLISVSRKLRKENFDLALVLPNSPRSALEVWLARVPQRVGYTRPWRNWFLTQCVQDRPGAILMRKRSVNEINRLNRAPAQPQLSTLNPQLFSAHHLHQYLHLAAALGAKPEPLPPRLVVTDQEIAAVEKKFGLAAAGTGGCPVFALNPGAEYGPAKRWPVERYISAATEIQQRTNCFWLILGGQSDFELAERVAAGIAPHASRLTLHANLAGRTSLRELMGLLKRARLLLTNDTGPMHVAAALGTPVVVPFGSTSPELTGPGLPGDPRHRLLKSEAPCSPCFLRECPIDFRCMNGLRVERVVEAVLSVVR